MLLYKFSPGQKFTFLKLVRDIATADKTLQSGERDIIRELCDEMDISLVNITTTLDHNSLSEIFNTRESRVLVMIELARISLSDKVFAFGESEILNGTRIKFGFSKKEMNDILRLAEVYGLLRQGIKMLAAG